MQKLNMEDHNDMCDKRENSVNIMIEKEFVTSNIDVAASEDELNSPRGKSSKKMKYSATQIQDLEVYVSFQLFLQLLICLYFI